MKVSPETDIRAEWYEAEGTAHPAVLSASMKIVRTIFTLYSHQAGAVTLLFRR